MVDLGGLPDNSAQPPRLRTRRGARFFRSSFVIALAMGLLGLTVLACLAAPLTAPFDPTEVSTVRLSGPSSSHLFGTDEIGRDLLSRVLYGGRLTIIIATCATLIAMILGSLWGMVAAFVRGLFDEVLMRLADSLMAIPQILLALVFVAAFDANATSLTVIIGILLTPTTARLVRSATLVELENDYVAAAIAYGVRRRLLLFSEIVPNLRGPLTVQAAVNVANAIILEAALSFVGLGIAAPEASWGTLVRQGYVQIYQTAWYVTFPAALIFLTIWMLNLLADQIGSSDDRKASPRG